MNNVIYMEDRRPGLHFYNLQSGDREPAVKIKAKLSDNKKYYLINTPYYLRGLGIKLVDNRCVNRFGEELKNWKTYRVTMRALRKLEKRYPIGVELMD